MITMLHYDAVFSPTALQQASKRQVILQAQHLAYLEQHPYEPYGLNEIERAKDLLKREMEVVKKGMGHGELSLESYTHVWEQCLEEV